MMAFDYAKIYQDQFSLFFKEDDLGKNFTYSSSLPNRKVKCELKIKDDMLLAGLPFFFETFNFISNEKIDYSEQLQFEGKEFLKNESKVLYFELDFDIALTGERIALNLLQHASSIATNTKHYVEAAGGLKVLDTRKTTPGLRFIEKYAVRAGGGYNHRFGQMDAWMVKDNHKKVFGGVENAIKYFQNLQTFYQPIIVEIHDLTELSLASSVGAKHFLLDNFTPAEVRDAVSMKEDDMTFEVSGGITLENMKNYIMEGVDAFSSGGMTYNAPKVDLSLKFS